jgi:hypothetical protein
MKALLACVSVWVLLASVAVADFSGPYDHSLWTFDAYGGDGSATGDADTLVLTGDDAPGIIITMYTIEAPGDGTFSFDWSYACTDEPGWDAGGYVVAGLLYMVSQTSGEQGSVSVPVLEGDTIGFFVDTSYGCNGPGVLTVTNFSGPTPSGAPVGACCLIQPGCVDGMFESECIRLGGTYMGDGTVCEDVDCGPEPPPAELVLLGSNIDLTTPNGCWAAYPTLAFNSQDDEFLLVWQEESASHPCDIAAQRVTATGTLVGGVATVIMADAYQVDPSVAYNVVDNEYLAAWRSQMGWPDFNSSVGQRFAADLTLLGSPYQLTETGVGFENSLVYNSVNNEYFLTARSYTPDPAGIFGSRIAGGTVVDPSVEIDTTQGITFLDPAPNGEVAYNSLDNQYLATYAVQGYPTWSAYNLRGCITNADGTLAGPPFAITFPPIFRAFYRAATVAFDPNAGRYLVAYGDERTAIPLHGQFVDRDGTLLGTPFELSDPMVDGQVAPRLAFDPVNDVYLLTWCRSPIAEPTRILAQLLAADGTPLGDPLVLTTTAYHMPFVCANSNSGGFLVVWRDIRNRPTSTDIFGQFIDVQFLCAGDLDADGDTDQSDLGILLADWGCMSDCAGDLDGDDDTDQSDLGILLADWGCGTAP